MTLTKVFQLALLAAMPAVTGATTQAAEYTGPSSSQSPYLLATQPDVDLVSLLTVGDSVNLKADGVTPYRFVGIPDGLGAFDNYDGTFTVLVNHELTSGVGVVRDHGAKGAFVSRWVINKRTLQVARGEDLDKRSYLWDVATGSYVLSTTIPTKAAFSRFCSADLAAASAFYDKRSGLGYRGRIFLDGEESGVEGRAVAHLLNGNSYELPALGKFSWENAVANPKTGRKTVVVGTDDGTGGQVYVYVGSKTRSKDPIAAAGLSGGVVYGIKVNGFPAEIPATGIPSGTTFTAALLGDYTSKTGAQLEADSVANAVTSFQRPEDGSWDPQHPNDFYFNTTASFTGFSRLWRLHFVDASKPELGGTIDMVLDGSEGQKMLDNLTVSHGKVLLQEDVGNNAHIGKLWEYDIASDTSRQIAQHDPSRFLLGGANFLTQDEESSGVIPVDKILGRGWYLAVVQSHLASDVELVEGGQLLALHVGPYHHDDDDDHDGDDDDRDCNR